MLQATPTPSSSSSNFQYALNAALDAYEKKTKTKLLTHPLAVQLQSCDSPAAILSVLQNLIHQFDHRRSSNEKVTSWLNPTVNVLYTFSTTLSAGISLIFSPAQVIFAGIGVLLLAVNDVVASKDVLVDIFERLESFFRRLESYTEVSPTTAMTDMIVKIMVEVLSVLAIATKEIKQRKSKKYLRKLFGKNDIEDALRRLDKLTQEEVRMATAEVLNVTHGVNDKMKVLIEDGKEVAEIVQQTRNETQDVQQTANETKEIMERAATEAAVIMQQTASDVDNVKRSQLREKFQTWLSPPDPSTNHNIARKVHYKGTATWFFRGSIFQQWKSSPSLLWIHGKHPNHPPVPE
ncbi:hypothetical protein BJV74DRAFT_986495 [Russula compacta]|nr:hypothetical protein BJV74DRAFT_986495 [Russula compacta]